MIALVDTATQCNEKYITFRTLTSTGTSEASLVCFSRSTTFVGI